MIIFESVFTIFVLRVKFKAARCDIDNIRANMKLSKICEMIINGSLLTTYESVLIELKLVLEPKIEPSFTFLRVQLRNTNCISVFSYTKPRPRFKFV
jgi:hypothetical protein